jgi:hypothetical protein
MAQVEVKVKLDLPPGVELLGYERSGDGHGFEVKFPLPDFCRCEKCGHEEPFTYEYKNTVYVVRDLDLWGQRRRGGHQQQSPRDHQAMLRGEVVRHAVEPPDTRPEPCPGRWRGEPSPSYAKSSVA